ncbi:putative VPS9 domain-containing protein [Plasmopara halstedii]
MQQWMEEDKNLLRRMKLLSVSCTLDILAHFSVPILILRYVLNLSRGDSGSRPVPMTFASIIYIVLHSRISRLCSNCEYISAYRNQADLMSNGYCFVNLRSAIEFIMVMDGSCCRSRMANSKGKKP